MRTTIAGVVGAQLPRHEDWSVSDSDDQVCRWSYDGDHHEPASLTLSFVDEEWTASASVSGVTKDAIGDDIPSYKVTVAEADSLFEATDKISEWMESPPTPSG